MNKGLKKTINGVVSSLIAVVLAAGTAVANPTIINADTPKDGSVTVTNAVDGESYSIYKVFDAVPEDANATGDARKIAYTYDGTNEAFVTALKGIDSPFEVDGTKSPYNIILKKAVADSEDKGASAVTSFLNANKSNLGTAIDTKTAENNTVSFTGLSYGYYYVTTTTGSAVLIDSAAKNATIAEKNNVPTVDKQQKIADDTGDYTDKDLSADIGKTVDYQITVSAGENDDKTMSVTDTLSTGLTLNHNGNTLTDNWSIKKNGTDITEGYTLSEVTDQSFKIDFTEDFVKAFTGDDKVVITYSAKINANAVTGADGNTNEVELDYSNQHSTKTTKVHTYEFDLVKTDDNKTVLTGAEFKLYTGTAGSGDAVTKSGDAVQFVKIGDTYRVATAEEVADAAVTTTDTIEAGNVTISGLGDGTYALEETKAPDGYNKLMNLKKVTVNDANNKATVTTTDNVKKYVDGGIQVINNSGSILPNAGGIGTTIFYTVGAALIIVAAVLIYKNKNTVEQ